MSEAREWLEAQDDRFDCIKRAMQVCNVVRLLEAYALSRESSELSVLRAQLTAAETEIERLKHWEDLAKSIPDYWQQILGDATSYKPAKLGKHAASHPINVKRLIAEHAGTETADVLVALTWQSCLAWEGQRFLGEQVGEIAVEREAAEAKNAELSKEILRLDEVIRQLHAEVVDARAEQEKR